MPSYALQKLVCPCCNNERFGSQFPPNSVLCSHCSATLSYSQVFLAGREFERREHVYRTQTRAGRKSVRVERRLTEHAAAGGKRCSECHTRKPATLEYFGTCNARSDQLQPACKECNNTRATLLRRPGGLELWRTLRTALRMRNEPAAPAAGTPLVELVVK